MAVKGGRPPEEGRVRTWTHVGAKPGGEWEAWSAGDAICVNCHVGDDASTPCMKHYLGKNAVCERCSKQHRTEFLYYQPLWRETDGKPVVVIFHADQRDVLERLRPGVFVVVGRGEEKKAGMYIRVMLKQREFQTAFAWKKQGQDISDFLPTLFRMRGAISGVMLLAGGMEQAQEKAAGEKKDKPATVGPRNESEATELVHNRLTLDGVPLGDVMGDVLDRLPNLARKLGKPATNGKHGKRDG